MFVPPRKHALEETGVTCFLGGPTFRPHVLPGPVLPRCPAVRRPAPTRLWYVRV